jgi:hypothetical protein
MPLVDSPALQRLFPNQGDPTELANTLRAQLAGEAAF